MNFRACIFYQNNYEAISSNKGNRLLLWQNVNTFSTLSLSLKYQSDIPVEKGGSSQNLKRTMLAMVKLMNLDIDKHFKCVQLINGKFLEN